LLLRTIVGLGFIEHGYAKRARGPESFAAFLHVLGMPAPGFLSWATIVTELVGGAAVLLGLFVPLVSIPMIAVLAVTSVDPSGAYFGRRGYETSLLYMAALVALALGGSGPLSLGRMLPHRWRRLSDPALEPTDSRRT
jgi:putative oxidoreductase